MVLPSFSTASHLFTAIIHALPRSWAIPATLESCSVKPSCASIIITHTVALSTAILARRTLYFSIASSTLLLRRIPAVSMKMNFPNRFSINVSVASLVVPAIFETMTRSSPAMALISEDLPTFGLPITATRILSSSSSSSSSSGKYLITSSSRSPVPWP